MLPANITTYGVGMPVSTLGVGPARAALCFDSQALPLRLRGPDGDDREKQRKRAHRHGTWTTSLHFEALCQARPGP